MNETVCPTPMVDVKERRRLRSKERRETFAAFLAFAALVIFAGWSYGTLMRGSVYSEIQANPSLNKFARVIKSSPALAAELSREETSFTVIAPSNKAFEDGNIAFAADAEDMAADDGRLVRLDKKTPYILLGDGYVIRKLVLPKDIARAKTLKFPSTDKHKIVLKYVDRGREHLLTVNGVPVRDEMSADNGIVYVVDKLIHPLK